VQLFDSWVGTLSPEDYRAAVLPHSRRVFEALAGTGVPRVHFGVGTGELLGLMSEAGADVVGVDWRVRLDEAVRRVDIGTALQGTLDPAVLLAPWEVVERRARDVLSRGRTAEGHIFNLGHGVLPETEPDVLARLTDYVHEQTVQEDAAGPRGAQSAGRGRAGPPPARPRASPRRPRRAAKPAMITTSTTGSGAPRPASTPDAPRCRACHPAASPPVNPLASFTGRAGGGACLLTSRTDTVPY